MSKKVSLALIVKNEEKNLKDCIDSFKGAFDELVVIDTGSTDKTIQVILDLDAKVYPFQWNDNFAEARQYSFDKCTGDFIIWADADDRLCEGGAARIRQIVEKNLADIHFIISQVGTDRLWRERIIRKGSGKWTRRIHENFEPNPEARIARVKGVEIIHPSVLNKKESFDRNFKILSEVTKETKFDLFYLASEYFRKGDFENTKKYSLSALQLGLDQNFRYELLFMIALSSKDSERNKYALSAYSLCPYRREAIILLCQEALKSGQDAKALAYARQFYSLPFPNFEFFGIQRSWYTWNGSDLFVQCLRRNKLYRDAINVESANRGGRPPVISLIHATRGRALKMVQCREKWLLKAKNPQFIEHFFIVDGDDSPEVIETAKDYCHAIIQPGGGCVAAWNAGASLSTGQILIQLSDDWIPPQDWDEIIIERMGDKITDEAVLAVSDGIIREDGKMTKCLCMAIMTRERYLAQGHMFHREYLSVYSDNEFTDRAYEDNVVIEARDVVFEHIHPISGKIAMDATYDAQNAPSRYAKGEETYLKRKTRHKALSREYGAFILATKDDFCLLEVCQRLREEGVKHIWFGIPDEYWNGKKNTEQNRDEVLKIAAKIQGSVAMELEVGKYRAPDRHILETEAMVRNSMLDTMRSQGIEHVLVVDGDELWLPGTLKKVDQYIDDNSPTSLSIRMIPVAGLPGYPISGGTDLAMIYLAPGVKFSQCRSSEGDQFIYPRRNVIHFTATRKTMDEIIQKHLESGHYTDPAYAFDWWFKNKLPFIKPGTKDAHMYTKWSTWPLVREWTKEEWSIIPDSIKPYLGEPK